jgi:hypothetical protein
VIFNSRKTEGPRVRLPSQDIKERTKPKSARSVNEKYFFVDTTSCWLKKEIFSGCYSCLRGKATEYNIVTVPIDNRLNAAQSGGSTILCLLPCGVTAANKPRKACCCGWTSFLALIISLSINKNEIPHSVTNNPTEKNVDRNISRPFVFEGCFRRSR